MTKTAAFFDFDGTLYTGHIWQDLVAHHRAARRHRHWVATYVARNMALYPLYKLGLMSQTAFYGHWGQTMGWLLRNWSPTEAQALFEKLTENQILPNLQPEIVARLDQHRAQGHLVALVSGTFAPWLEVVARRLDVPHAIGTPLEVRKGRYTGRIVPPLCQGAGKPARLSAYLTERDLDVDLGTSYAYADSGTDLPLLLLVGHPFAVNPDDALRAEAQTRRWPILEWAK